MTEKMSPWNDHLSGILRNMKNKTVLVIGDIMLDHYIWGSVDRISPEAPVPVVDVQKEAFRLGGAGNVTKNIFEFGALPLLCGMVGNDLEGGTVLSDLCDCNIQTGYIRVGTKSTTVKTRIIAHTQQVVRLDKEDRHTITDEETDLLLRTVDNLLDSVDAIIVSDYDKGVVSRRLLEGLSELTAEKIPVFIDPKEKNFRFYKGFHAINPNIKELSFGSGIHISCYGDLLKAAHLVKEELGCKNLLVTRGEQGMTIFEEDGSITNIAARAKHVFDVTGAGDTVISAFTLASIAGASAKEAAIIANIAASIVVGEVGTAAVSFDRLLHECREEGLL